MVAYARDAAEKASLTKQLSFCLGDMKDLPFDDDTFDWVWSMDSVGYAPIEPLPLIEELSSDYILNAPDYYGFYTYSLFQGKVPI